MAKRRKHSRYIPDKHLKIFDNNSSEYIGLLANFSTDGIMIVSREKIKASSVLKCRVELLQPIMNYNDIIFEAHQRWSRKNIDKGWWESGYNIETTGINKELLSYLSIVFVAENLKISGIKDVSTTPAENLRKTTRYEAKDRYPVYQKFSYHEIGKLADLSIVGSSFITQEHIKKGTLLNCKVKLPKTIFQQDYLFFDAKCMWCKKYGDAGSYKSGYKLHNVSDKDKVLILYLILHYLEEKKTDQRFCIVNSPKPIRA